MKWIGQHIYDQISRFRNGVYLDTVSTSSEVAPDLLIVDSNGLIAKRAMDAIAIDVSDFMADGINNAVLTATGTDGMIAEAYFTFQNLDDASVLTLLSNEDTGDYFSIGITSHGATTIRTLDDDAAAANMTFDIDGTYNMNSAGLATITSAGVEIANNSTTGATALLIDNDDTDQVALDIEAANVDSPAVRIKVPDLTTANAVYINADSLTTGTAIKLDVDDALTTNADKSLLIIDYDKAGVTASGQTNATTGLEISMIDAATNNASGTVTNIGVKVAIDAASNQGTISQTGYSAQLTDGDVGTTIGYSSNVEDGGIDFKAVSSAETRDFCAISTTTNGATTVKTVDEGAAAAHFEIAADGDIILDANGQIKLEPVAGNNILLDGTVTVDGGSVTGITTLGVDSVSLTAIQTASESFVDNDTSVMTSASINDAIIKGGDVTYINILPHEFLADEGGGANKSAQFDDSDAGGGTVDIGVSVGSTSASLFAFVDIPVGKTATGVTVYGSNTGNAITVYESNVKTGTLTSKGSGSTDTGDDSEAINITDVAGTSTNYLVIKSAIAATTNTIWGAQVTVSG